MPHRHSYRQRRHEENEIRSSAVSWPFVFVSQRQSGGEAICICTFAQAMTLTSNFSVCTLGTLPLTKRARLCFSVRATLLSQEQSRTPLLKQPRSALLTTRLTSQNGSESTGSTTQQAPFSRTTTRSCPLLLDMFSSNFTFLSRHPLSQQ